MNRQTENSSSIKDVIASTEVDDEFQKTFQWVLEQLPKVLPDSSKYDTSEILEWLKLVMNYNVPHGKQIRGRFVEFAYKILVPHHRMEDLEACRILGWCVELLQAGFLIADDIMDNGITRRGRPCWYRVNGLGNIAVNDAFLLEHLAFQIIQNFFGNLTVHGDLIKVMLDVTFKTVMGQSSDTRASLGRRFDDYSDSRYNWIVTFKTSYYTTYLPVALAMILSGFAKNDAGTQQLWSNVKEITLAIGTLFQVQDDYFDCFTDKNATGKVGTDIQEGKCTWLFVTAKKLCTNSQYHILLQNYGIDRVENVENVKRLYVELGIPDAFSSYRESMRFSIKASIDNLEEAKIKTVLQELLEKICSRTR